MKEIKLEDPDCSVKEYTIYSSFSSMAPQSQQSNFWSLKWLFNHSPSFNKKFGQLEIKNLAAVKYTIFEMVGPKGFDRLEMAAPYAMMREFYFLYYKSTMEIS